MRYALACWMASAPLLLAAAPPEGALQIDDVYHLVGLGDVPRGAHGHLYVRNGGLAFYSDRGSARLDRDEITAANLDRDTRPLIDGTTGKLILFAPFGSGKAIGMIRPGIDILTLISSDPNGGSRDAVFFLPKGTGESARTLLDTAGPRNRPLPASTVPVHRAFIQPTNRLPLSRQVANLYLTAIQVGDVTGCEDSLPSAWRAAIYEGTIRKLRESGRFQHVLRTGDRSAARYADLAVLRLDIVSFAHGSDRLRNLTAYAGATSIAADVNLTSRSGTVLASSGVRAKVQTFGESLEITDRIVHALGKAFAR